MPKKEHPAKQHSAVEKKEEKREEKREERKENKEEEIKETLGENGQDINESPYQEAVRLMNSINCMTLCNEKADMYLRAAQKFSSIKSYKDSEICMAKCLKQAENIKEQIKKAAYERALNIKMEAKSEEDYRQAAEEFKVISGYKDADKLATECEGLYNYVGLKGYKKRLLKLGGGIVIIAVIILGLLLPYTQYYMAGALSAIGGYNSAIRIYSELGNYKDSAEKLKKNQYLYGVSYEAEGDYKNAKKAFAAADGYEDSLKKQVELEKLIIKESAVGDTVKIGDYNWLILDIKEDKAFLIKKTAIKGIAYNESEEEITWENSTLRAYLNSDFYNTFSEYERNNILQVNVENEDNAIYNTDGGNDTKDSVYLLSSQEALQYKDIMPKLKNISWLRTPGFTGTSAAFLSLKGTVMDYGYVVNSNELSAFPVLWFDLN